MTRRPFASVVSRMWVAIPMVMAAGVATVVLAQAPTPDGHHDMTSSAAAAGKMMTGHKELMAGMAASNERLGELLAKMNAAQGDERVAAIAAVVTELAAQRLQMQQMMSLQTGMMDRMMAHMATMHAVGGMNKQAPKPAPDTKGLTEDHSGHHPDR